MDSFPRFTYASYLSLLKGAAENDYDFASYSNWMEKNRPLILRHDIDQSIRKAYELAKIEAINGYNSTWFVLVSSDFYNPLSPGSISMLRELVEMGHRLGLHFDETAYPGIELDAGLYEKAVDEEKRVLEDAVGFSLHAVSMHRPSQKSLQMGEVIAGLPNSYSSVFFKSFKYVSDSRRRWREPAFDIVLSRRYDKLHILTHAFWYNEVEMGAKETLESFVDSASQERMRLLEENITNLESLMV